MKRFKTFLCVFAALLATILLALWLQVRQYEQDILVEISSKISDVYWPEVFTNPDFQYPSDVSVEEVLADALSGWGCCYLEEKPQNFGNGMRKIQDILGTCKPQDLIEMADEFLSCNTEADKVRI